MKFGVCLMSAIFWTLFAIAITVLYVLYCPYKWAIISPICAVIVAALRWVIVAIKTK